MEINDYDALNVFVIRKIYQHTQQGICINLLCADTEDCGSGAVGLSRTKAFHYKADDENPINKVVFSLAYLVRQHLQFLHYTARTHIVILSQLAKKVRPLRFMFLVGFL